MPLGFTPISSAPLGGSPKLASVAQQTGGVLAQVNPVGLTASVFLGTATVVLKVNHRLTESFAAVATLDILGSISATSPQMTTFTRGFAPAMTLGTGFAGGSFVAIPVSVDAMSGLLGVAAGFAPTAYVTGFTATMTLGAFGAGDPWIEIKPVTSPGWTDVVIRTQR